MCAFCQYAYVFLSNASSVPNGLISISMTFTYMNEWWEGESWLEEWTCLSWIGRREWGWAWLCIVVAWKYEEVEVLLLRYISIHRLNWNYWYHIKQLIVEGGLVGHDLILIVKYDMEVRGWRSWSKLKMTVCTSRGLGFELDDLMSTISFVTTIQCLPTSTAP